MDFIKNSLGIKHTEHENADIFPTDKGNASSKGLYHFDPSGLERAAKAADRLANDPKAEEILKMAMLDMNNKRLEIQKQQKEYEYKLEVAKADSIKQQHQQAVDYLKEEAKNHKIKAEYEDFLTRKRNQDRMELDKKSQEELMKVQEDSVKKQEDLRRSTIEYEFKLRKENDVAATSAFWKNKINYKLGTKDLQLEKMKVDFEHKMKHSAMVLNSVSNMIANTFNIFYENPLKFVSLAIGAGLFVGAVAISRRGAILSARKIEARLFTPKLVRETGKASAAQSISAINLQKKGLIFNPDTEKSLNEIVTSTIKSIENKSYFRNYLFYGPPGTGKTLFAKELAMNAGLQYAIITGGDLVPLRENAVTELYKVMDWSKKKQNLLLFLDEADAFLKKRDEVEIGENMRSALNAFLYRTGESSKGMMLVLATNRPEQLDSAVTDRIDMMVEFTLPNSKTREYLMKHYCDAYLVVSKNSNAKEVLESCLGEIVALTEGLSSREISKLCILFHTVAACAPDGILTKEMLIDAANRTKVQCTKKQLWSTINANKKTRV